MRPKGSRGGPTYLFILRHRLPIGMMRAGWEPWLGTMGTNTAIAILVAAIIRPVGFGPFLLVHLPITVLAASIGVRLFYIQHQFEGTSWSHDESTKLRYRAFPLSLAGCFALVHSEPYTTSITCAVEFLAIDCRSCCGIICSLPPSDESPCSKVCGVYDWLCGMRTSGGSFLLGRRPWAPYRTKDRPT